MNIRALLIAGAGMLALAPVSNAEVKVVTEHRTGTPAFRFTPVPMPVDKDAATQAKFTLVDGEEDPNSGGLAVLHDGRIPTGEDQPTENFFFRAGSDGGRLLVDMGRAMAVKQVNTYSWHTGPRAPQVYKLFASDGAADGFASSPRRPIDPESCGWKHIASVDTRPKEGEGGGQHGVSVSDPSAADFGKYRYLLFDISRTEERDQFGNTFFSEIDVIDSNGPAPTVAIVTNREPILKSFTTAEGKYHFTIDSTEAPDLTEWADTKLQPVVQEWYPKLVAMLPSEGFEARTNVTLRFQNDMGRTPAMAGGGRISMNAGWFRRELNREAVGSVVDEMVHVVQSYGGGRRRNPDAPRTPGWLVEGIPDYIRWFLYEPDTKGAEITEKNLSRAKYDASYRITGNFLNWVTERYDKEIVRKLNTAARQGKYSEQLWKDCTSKTLQELGDEWRKGHEERLSKDKPKTEDRDSSAK